ncbi:MULTISPECIES: hypothetical protein [Paenibacillus]|uniref:hypothetical protein n=1 Tax=Paenibacillus TaxID=44249 RepID=UPI00240D83FC|nr:MULTISPECIES: hypothetical protein [Paenibacillus]MCI1777679.1 hypothetical protein [Paenibacillus lautus]WFB57617.1 hypothetical protein P0X86_27225 [Paenibacillus sp. BR1-192]
MREYKFRGKCIDPGEMNGKFIYGDLIRSKDKFFIKPFSNAVNVEGHLGLMVVMHEVDPETVGQYTGQGDFYAGDIAKSPRGSIGIIAWHDSWCGFYFKTMFGHNDEGKLVRMHSSIPLYNDLPNYIKLGNRWDNSDLLEVEKV